VVVSVSVNSSGEVTDARVVSSQGPEELRRAVLSSVLNWHFSTDRWDVGGVTRPIPPSFEIAVEFDGARQLPERTSPEPPQLAGRSYTVERITWSSPPSGPLREKIAGAGGLIQVGDTIASERFREIEKGLRAIDSHLQLGVAIKDDRVTLRISIEPSAAPQTNVFRGRDYAFTGPAAPAANSSDGQSAPTPQRIRVGGNVQQANLVEKVTPVYPPLAKQARVQGVVKFDVVISKEGYVINLGLISGHPLLAPAATEAVQQWRYRPTLLNGEPVEVATQVDINFTLSE